MEHTITVTEGKMDITDPCYDRGTWCAVWEHKVKNGTYDVKAEYSPDNRVASLTATHKDIKVYLQPKDYEEVFNQIGVDAGLCGFFPNKRDYDNGEWHKVCDMLNEQDKKDDSRVYEYDNGVFSASGWGDGVYSLFIHKDDKGETDVLRLVFIDWE